MSAGPKDDFKRTFSWDLFFGIGSAAGLFAMLLSAVNWNRDLSVQERKDHDEVTIALDRIEGQLGGDGNSYIPACAGEPNAALHKSLRELDLLLSRDSTRARAMLYRAVCLFCLGEEEKSLEYFRSKIFAMNPDSPDAHIYFGTLHFRAGMFDGAKVWLKRGTEASPKRAEAFMTLGLTYMAAGEFGEAETVFRDLLEVDPNFPSAYVELAAALLAQGRDKVGEARRVMKEEEEIIKALEYDPSQRRREVLEVLERIEK